MKNYPDRTGEDFGNRVRFNWGFWDARSDRRSRRERRVEGGDFLPLPDSDLAYCDGYRYGWMDEYQESDSSESAWHDCASEAA